MHYDIIIKLSFLKPATDVCCRRYNINTGQKLNVLFFALWNHHLQGRLQTNSLFWLVSNINGSPYSQAVLHFQVLHFPPLRFGPAFWGPAFSITAIWSSIFRSCVFWSCIFSAPAWLFAIRRISYRLEQTKHAWINSRTKGWWNVNAVLVFSG